MENNRLAILGASGHGLVAYDVAIKNNYEVVGWFDTNKPKNSKICDLKVLGAFKDILNVYNKNGFNKIFVAVSNNYSRYILTKQMMKFLKKEVFINLIHPQAVLGEGVSMGIGNLVMPNTVIGAYSKLGNFCIINTNSSIDHECKINNYVSILPNACLAGNVSVGDRTCIAMGTNIIHNINIGKDSLIGAGSLVIRDIPKLVVSFGQPSKTIKSRKINEKAF